MSAQVIDGRALSDQMLDEAAQDVAYLKHNSGVTPGLAAVLVGDDPPSHIYVRNKQRACERVGISAHTFALPANVTEASVIDRVHQLNSDDRFHGVMVQLPLPLHVRSSLVVEAIAPQKDVDGMHPITMGRLVSGLPTFLPATPLGIHELLLRSGYSPAGKHVVICGRSDLVGKPLALLLMGKANDANATVTVCHTGTPDLAGYMRQADIIVAAIGSPNFLTSDVVAPGCVVVDVGINRIQDPTTRTGYRIVGDVDFEQVRHIASAITPVPGGVGPMTVAALVSNTIQATRLGLPGEGGSVPAASVVTGK